MQIIGSYLVIRLEYIKNLDELIQEVKELTGRETTIYNGNLVVKLLEKDMERYPFKIINSIKKAVLRKEVNTMYYDFNFRKVDILKMTGLTAPTLDKYLKNN